MNVLDLIAFFVFLSGVFIYLNTHWLKLPSSIGLMILALGLSAVMLVVSQIYPEIREEINALMETHDYEEVLYQIMLSFMLFAGALHVDFKKLAEERRSVLLLALFGVLINTAVVGFSTYFILQFVGLELNYLYCLVFGALISPTDPVAVTSAFNKLKVSKNIEAQIVGESLFNDGIAVVLALTLLDLAFAGTDHRLNAFEVFYVFTAEVGGGIIIGLLLGYVGYRILKFINNEHVELEVLVTLAVLMLGLQFAEFIHVSSKQAAVIMGLVIGNEGKGQIVSSSASEYVFRFWSLIEESFNAMLFVLIGLEMIVIPLNLNFFAAGFFVFTLVLFSRWISVAIPMVFLQKGHFRRGTTNILAWGAIKGGISIALTLSLPDFEGKGLMMTITYTVVVLSILYQGLAVPKVMAASRIR